jgi:hypothetical protein
MSDLIVTHACVIPARFRVRDHCMFVINFQESSMVGLAPFRVQLYSSQCLNTNVLCGAMQQYVNRLEENISRHCLIEKLSILHHRYAKRKTFQCKLNKLDKQSRDLMLNAKKKCRCINSGQIPFLPEAAWWIRRTQVYCSLLQFHNGHIQNRWSLKITSRQCGIELQVRIQKYDYFWKNGKQYPRKHLNDCLARARDKEDSNKEREILGIIQCKKDRSFWCQLNYVMGKPRSGSVWQVLVEDEEHGTLTEHVTQEWVQKAIFDNIHRKPLFLAEAAPACNGPLGGLFGYNANTITAQCILNMTYTFLEDFDQATKEICKECACIKFMIPKDSLNITITKVNW